MKLLLAIRPVNLIIIGLLQWVFYHRFILNIADKYNLESIFSGAKLNYFILTTLLLAATGYLINDYFDFEGDLKNKKSNRLLSRSYVILSYYILTIIAFAIAQYLSIIMGQPLLSIVFVFMASCLFWYSKHLKGWSLFGNLFVSLFCALAILIFPICDYQILHQLSIIDYAQFQHTLSIFIIYGAFAFLLTMVRELVKDIEDREGDLTAGLQTFAIVQGPEKSKILALFNAAILFIVLLICIYSFPAFRQNFISVAISYFIVILMVVLMLLLYFAQSKKQFNQISLLSKFIMITGICFLISLPWT